MKSTYITKCAFLTTLSLCMFILPQCQKLAEVDAPGTSINETNVYRTDPTAIAVLTGIYAKLSANNDLTGFSVIGGLTADELTLWDINNASYLEYYRNQLSSSSTSFITYWIRIYPYIYVANSAIEGLNKSTLLNPLVKKQLLGEAYFVRAFCLFYLTNLFGDTCVPLTSDYAVNSQIPRSPGSEVYKQIISDLKEAKNNLATDFVDATLLKSSTERVRPNQYAASALLARTYLYTKDYLNAESEASIVINRKDLYDTVSLNQAFLKNSKEAIWQLQPVNSGINSNTYDGRTFILPTTGPSSSFPIYLSQNQMNSFETNDLRKNNWTKSVLVGSITYSYAFKYKIGAINTPTAEYQMVLRLAEQYLIRAEARAKLDNINGGLTDLNLVRKRAGLPASTATNKDALIMAVEHERQTELFTEWGHRWFDLKRTERVDPVMTVILLQKGGGAWNPNKALFPVPAKELEKNLKLTQNAGY